MFYFLFLLLLITPNLYALEVLPSTINLGFVEKDTLYPYKLYIKNNSSSPIDLKGSVDTCGVSIKVPKGKIGVNEVVVGDLNIYAGSNIGLFNLKSYLIIEEAEEIKKVPIEVSYYIKPDSLPYVESVKKKISLGSFFVGEAKEFYIDFLNISDRFANLKLVGNYKGIILPADISIPANSKKTIKGIILDNEVGQKSYEIVYNYENPASDVRFSINYEVKNERDKYLTIDLIKTEGEIIYKFKVQKGKRVYLYDIDDFLKIKQIILIDDVFNLKIKKNDSKMKYFLIGIPNE